MAKARRHEALVQHGDMWEPRKTGGPQAIEACRAARRHRLFIGLS
jgi:hypothetical protein